MFFCPKSTKGNKISSEYAKGLKVVYSAGSKAMGPHAWARPKAWWPASKVVGHVSHANSPALCQPRNSACRGAHGATDGTMTNGGNAGSAWAPAIRGRAKSAASWPSPCPRTPQGEIRFLSDIRCMNIGMTRARRKLLLLGDSSALCRHPFLWEL